MWREKKQLLPKDLAARAEKLSPEKVEAEVLRIVSAKPKVTPVPGRVLPGGSGLGGLGQMQPGQIVPRELMPPPHEWQRLALQAQQPFPRGHADLEGPGSPWGF
jgi:hypothetical protein